MNAEALKTKSILVPMDPVVSIARTMISHAVILGIAAGVLYALTDNEICVAIALAGGLGVVCLMAAHQWPIYKILRTIRFVRISDNAISVLGEENQLLGQLPWNQIIDITLDFESKLASPSNKMMAVFILDSSALEWNWPLTHNARPVLFLGFFKGRDLFTILKEYLENNRVSK